ncbi:class I SAM-dependent methyltransferase [Olsenella urininfantis]|uniref:class I SAM-dependent methyltransferase n=1 Tax=Olsenella urininfantis TaxID=1871033 RepID=UPI00098703C5|nr:class I SAM-dependent methyltransferase [Olsenella urininfantis]
MRKRFWDWSAPIYVWAMRADKGGYQWMYHRIAEVVRGRRVLELASGPGLIALNVAEATQSMVATDYSEGMVAEARRQAHSDKLRFEVADATDLPYADSSFDVVIIANALHIMPAPERALAEIGRVLTPGGTLVAPNFVMLQGSSGKNLWARFLELLGVRFESEWDADGYLAFLARCGWKPHYRELLPLRIPLLYVECERGQTLQ